MNTVNTPYDLYDQDASDIIINPRSSDIARSVVTNPRADVLNRLKTGRMRKHGQASPVSTMPLERRGPLTAKENRNSIYRLRRAGAIAMVATTSILTAGSPVNDVSTDIVRSGREAFVDFINPGMDTIATPNSGRTTLVSDIQSQSK